MLLQCVRLVLLRLNNRDAGQVRSHVECAFGGVGRTVSVNYPERMKSALAVRGERP